MKAPYISAVYKGDILIVKELGENDENPSDFAKRILIEKTGNKNIRIIALPKIDYIDVNDIEDEFRQNWPSGLLTIPQYNFTFAEDNV